jgi:hypothetical protein
MCFSARSPRRIERIPLARSAPRILGKGFGFHEHGPREAFGELVAAVLSEMGKAISLRRRSVSDFECTIKITDR